MVFVTNEAGLVTFLSQDWTSLTGQTLTDARNFGWTRVLHPDDREFVRDIVLKAIEAQCSFSVRYRLRTSEHEFFWVQAGAVPSFGPPGRTFLGFFGSLTLLDDPPGDIIVAAGDLRPIEVQSRPGSLLERAADHLLAAHSLLSGSTSVVTVQAVELALRRLGEELAGETLADTGTRTDMQ